MKKRLLTLLTAAMLCGMVSGCCVSHDWQEATCTAPKTCAKCGETEGEPLPHTWVEATCTEAKHCSVCGTTEGEPLPHEWVEATYETPKTCSVCGATEGEPKEFTVEDANQRFVQAIDVYQKNWINFTDEQMQDPEYMIRNEIIICLLNNSTQTTNIDSIENLDIKTKDGVELFQKVNENDFEDDSKTTDDYQYFVRFHLFSLLMSEACEEGKDISVIDYIESHDADEIVNEDQIDAYLNQKIVMPAYSQFPLMYDYLMENEVDKPEAVSIEETDGYLDFNGHKGSYNVTFNCNLYDGDTESTKILTFDQNGYIKG